MKKLLRMFEIDFKLQIREFSGVLFGIIMPMGIMILLGVLYGDKEAYDNSGYTLLQQSFPAVAAIGICATGLMGIPLTISSYREKGILKHLRVTPTSPGTLLGAQFLTNLIFALISALLVWTSARFIFQYEMIGNMSHFLLAFLLVIISIYSLGFMVASVSSNIKTANLLTSLLYFPMLFLSGATIPFEIMPQGLQKISSILPLTQGIKLIKNISLGMNEEIIKPIIVLLLTASAGIFVSLKTFRWE